MVAGAERPYEQPELELRIAMVGPLSFDDGHELGAELDKIGETEILYVPNTKSPAVSYDGARMLPVVIPEGVAPRDFQRVLTAAHLVYLGTSRLVPQDIAAMSGMNLQTVRNIANTEAFGIALQFRGVDYNTAGVLSPEQEAALMILTDIGSKHGFGKRLQLAGISHAVYLTWMKNPAFAKAMHSIAEQITDNSSVALVELGRKVGEGDFNSIKLQLEISGRHNPQQQQTVDMLVMMNKILESLATHLAGNPEILRLIASDMRQIASDANSFSANKVTNGLEF